MENVILKDVLGYEKFYKVSSNGVVFSKRKNKPLSPGEIALIFNTTRSNVGAIKIGKSWKHITL